MIDCDGVFNAFDCVMICGFWFRFFLDGTGCFLGLSEKSLLE
jgi:hypothetical protein